MKVTTWHLVVKVHTLHKVMCVCVLVCVCVLGSHLIWVGELELPSVSRPADEGLTGLIGQELQEKLPQLDGSAACKQTQMDTQRLTDQARCSLRDSQHHSQDTKSIQRLLESTNTIFLMFSCMSFEGRLISAIHQSDTYTRRHCVIRQGEQGPL